MWRVGSGEGDVLLESANAEIDFVNGGASKQRPLSLCPLGRQATATQLFPVDGLNKLTAEQLLKKQLRSFDVEPSKDRTHTRGPGATVSLRLHFVGGKVTHAHRCEAVERLTALVQFHHIFIKTRTRMRRTDSPINRMRTGECTNDLLTAH